MAVLCSGAAVGLEPKGRLSNPLAVDVRVLNDVILYSGP